ncbi:MAG: hypothetical protein C4567_08030 [Deltaproteobacteria bacterium]|nr:MAG: hypothetical protein C4567_08030 [Deltaproteobacteria bacterium]
MVRIFLMLFFFLAFLLSSSYSYSQSFPKGGLDLSNLPPGRAAAVLLYAFQQEGCLELRLVYPNPLLYVEPKFWQTLTHVEKVNFGKLALELVNTLNNETGYQCYWVFIKNMTTKEKLGTVHLLENRVEIFK